MFPEFIPAKQRLPANLFQPINSITNINDASQYATLYGQLNRSVPFITLNINYREFQWSFA
jgi:hypothetical protein